MTVSNEAMPDPWGRGLQPVPPSIEQIASQWDRNVSFRAAELESGIDVSYDMHLIPTLLDLVQRHGRGRRVLDAGCGLGYLAAKLVECGYEVQGIDVSAASVEYAMHKHAGIDFQESSIVSFSSARREPFDVCIANMVFHNLVDLPENLAAIRAMLSARGILIIAIPHPCFWLQCRDLPKGVRFAYLESSCFEVEFKIRRGSRHPSPITFVHRSIGHYARELSQANFAAREFREQADSNPKHPADLLYWVWKAS